MAVTIEIPSVLRPYTGGNARVRVEGDSVKIVLSQLTERYPDTRWQILSPEGDLNRFVNVYLNNEEVRVLDGLATAVSDGDVITVLPASSGG